MKTLKLALLGFGNAGQAFARLLTEKHQEIKDTYDYDIKVTAIATGSKGNLEDSKGIDLREALEELKSRNNFSAMKCLTGKTTMEIVEQAEYDVVVEMTPLNIETGEPAISHIKGALNRGKHVVTANKGPIAWAYRDLRDLARSKGAGFFYETTVMDGTPVFNLYDYTLRMAKVTEISGILNSTTNFILEEMAAGTEYDEIIKRGRKMGFIEANPAMDIEGYDAAAKITALANVLMDAGITPDMVERKGIEDITIEDIRKAASKGKVIKLLCQAGRDDDGKINVTVKPQEVDRTDILSTVNSTTSIISITTDLMKKLTVVEHEPEIEQTAYGVFGDLLRVIEHEHTDFRHK